MRAWGLAPELCLWELSDQVGMEFFIVPWLEFDLLEAIPLWLDDPNGQEIGKLSLIRCWIVNIVVFVG